MSERVTVTGPRRPGSWMPEHRAGDDPAEIVTARVRSLMRAQAALALRTCAAVASVVAGLPLLFACEPGLSRVRLLGVRLPWLILCAVVPLILVAAARRHVRLAEYAERAAPERDHEREQRS